MDKLRSQHQRLIYAVFPLAAAVYYFLLTSVPAAMEKLRILEWFGISWVVIAGAVIFLYEVWGWKIVNPSLNFSGRWTFGASAYPILSNSEYQLPYLGSKSVGDKLHGREGDNPDQQLRSPNQR